MKSAPFALALLLPLAACGDDSQEEAAAALANAERVECALAGAERFEPLCTVQRMSGPDGLTLTISGSDGSFRRLLVTRDGRGVVAADGAAVAQVSVAAGNRIEVVVDRDRYRLPATVRTGQQQGQ